MTDDRHRICPECGKKSHIRDSFEDGYCMVCASKYGALRISTEKAIELLRRVQDFCKDNNWHKEQGGKLTVSLHIDQVLAELRAESEPTEFAKHIRNFCDGHKQWYEIKLLLQACDIIDRQQKELDKLKDKYDRLDNFNCEMKRKLGTEIAELKEKIGGYEEVILEPMQKKYKYVCEENVELYNELAEQKTEIEQFKTLQQDHRRLTGEAINLRLERRKLRAELDRLKKSFRD